MKKIILLHFGNNKFIIANRFGDDESYDLETVTESQWVVRTDAEKNPSTFGVSGESHRVVPFIVRMRGQNIFGTM